VTYMWYISLIFRDLKPENVLVGSDGHLKISDYGLCKTGFFHHERANSICGTSFYMAPEVIITLNLKCCHWIFCLAVSVLCENCYHDVKLILISF
jgi:serine/threonine protein kinase